jgi:hypothetical protein
MIIEKRAKPIETILVDKIVKKTNFETKAKSFRKAIQSLIGVHYKNRNFELEKYTRGILDLYNKFHPTLPVEMERWKGKSSFEIIRNLGSIKIIKYQKPNRSSEPLKIEIEAFRDEITALLDSIKLLSKGEPIKTRKIAIVYSDKLNLGHNTWKDFFADRKNHNKLTLMLGALDKLGLIRYNGGLTEVIKLDIQMVL